MGLIHDIPTCEVLIKRIEREAIETMNRTQMLLSAGSLLVETSNGAAIAGDVGAEARVIGQSKL